MLFAEGQSFYAKGLKVLLRPVPRTGDSLSPARLLVVVPKRSYRRAHDRNRFRRILREAWRLQKQALYSAIPPDTCLHVGLIYTHKRPDPYSYMYEAVALSIYKLTKRITAEGSENKT